MLMFAGINSKIRGNFFQSDDLIQIGRELSPISTLATLYHELEHYYASKLRETVDEETYNILSPISPTRKDSYCDLYILRPCEYYAYSQEKKFIEDYNLENAVAEEYQNCVNLLLVSDKFADFTTLLSLANKNDNGVIKQEYDKIISGEYKSLMKTIETHAPAYKDRIQEILENIFSEEHNKKLSYPSKVDSLKVCISDSLRELLKAPKADVVSENINMSASIRNL